MTRQTVPPALREFTVNLWGSHPDNDRDDCWAGEDYATEAEALEAVRALREGSLDWGQSPGEYIELHFPERYEVKRVPGRLVESSEDDDWKREQAMQAGMGLGVDGYNDVMGW